MLLDIARFRKVPWIKTARASPLRIETCARAQNVVTPQSDFVTSHRQMERCFEKEWVGTPAAMPRREFENCYWCH